jgi:hypothetical protein
MDMPLGPWLAQYRAGEYQDAFIREGFTSVKVRRRTRTCAKLSWLP